LLIVEYGSMSGDCGHDGADGTTGTGYRPWLHEYPHAGIHRSVTTEAMSGLIWNSVTNAMHEKNITEVVCTLCFIRLPSEIPISARWAKREMPSIDHLEAAAAEASRRAVSELIVAVVPRKLSCMASRFENDATMLKGMCIRVRANDCAAYE
jgi:hypothetical protein